MTLTKGDLLKQVWQACTFDEIINAGLESGKCDSGMIINAAQDYEDSEKELMYTEADVNEIISNEDLDFILECLLNRYSKREILLSFENYQVFEEYDFDDVENYFYDDIFERTETAYREGYDDGYDAGENCLLKYVNEKPRSLKYGTPDDKWKFLCDELGVPYFYADALKKKLKDLLSDLNKSSYNLFKKEQF